MTRLVALRRSPREGVVMDDVYYTVPEVATRLGVSARWLADERRAGRVEHIHIARRRRFTAEQVDLLVKAHTVEPTGAVSEDAKRLDRTRVRVARRLVRW
jgi:Helix-turn-helix domain